MGKAGNTSPVSPPVVNVPSERSTVGLTEGVVAAPTLCCLFGAPPASQTEIACELRVGRRRVPPADAQKGTGPSCGHPPLLGALWAALSCPAAAAARCSSADL